MGKIVLVTGAARSGKSAFAENLAISSGQEVVYCATAQAFDLEMRDRIRLHRLRRPEEWSTLEEPLKVPESLKEYTGAARVLLLDCITLWISNLLLAELDDQGEPSPGCEQRIEARIEDLIKTVRRGEASMICVSNEVGWSLVPENKLGRLYRDIAGKANQILAKAAEQVYLVVAGYPMEIKASGEKILAEVRAK